MTTGNSGNEWGNQGVPKYGDNIYDPDYAPDPAPTVNFAAPAEPKSPATTSWADTPWTRPSAPPAASYVAHTEEAGPAREQAPDTSWMTHDSPVHRERDPRVERGVTQLKLMLIGVGKVALFGIGLVVVFCIVAFILGMISAVL